MIFCSLLTSSCKKLAENFSEECYAKTSTGGRMINKYTFIDGSLSEFIELRNLKIIFLKVTFSAML